MIAPTTTATRPTARTRAPPAIASPTTEAGERVDRCLAAAFPALSRSRIKALIEQGNLRIVRAGWRRGAKP